MGSWIARISSLNYCQYPRNHTQRDLHSPLEIVILSEVARAFCELRSRRTPKILTLPLRLILFRPHI